MSHTPASILSHSKASDHRFVKSTITNAAKQLGSLGGKIGGPARAQALSLAETRAIAIHAANIRWGNPCGCHYCKR